MYNLNSIIKKQFNYDNLEQARKQLDEYYRDNADVTIEQQILKGPEKFGQLASSRAQLEHLLPRLELEEFEDLEANLQNHFESIEKDFLRLESVELRLQRNTVEIEAKKELDTILSLQIQKAITCLTKYDEILQNSTSPVTKEKLSIYLKIAKSELFSKYGLCELFGQQQIESLENSFANIAEEYKNIPCKLEINLYRQELSGIPISDEVLTILELYPKEELIFGQIVKFLTLFEDYLNSFYDIIRKYNLEPYFSFCDILDEVDDSELCDDVTNDAMLYVEKELCVKDSKVFAEIMEECNKFSQICKLLDYLYEHEYVLSEEKKQYLDAFLYTIKNMIIDYLVECFEEDEVGPLSFYTEQLLIEFTSQLTHVLFTEAEAEKIEALKMKYYEQLKQQCSNILNASCYLNLEIPVMHKMDYNYLLKQQAEIDNPNVVFEVLRYVIYQEELELSEQELAQHILNHIIKMTQLLKISKAELLEFLNQLYCYINNVFLEISQSLLTLYDTIKISRYVKLENILDVIKNMIVEQEFQPKKTIVEMMTEIANNCNLLNNFYLPIVIEEIDMNNNNEMVELSPNFCNQIELIIEKQELEEENYFHNTDLLNQEEMQQIYEYNNKNIEFSVDCNKYLSLFSICDEYEEYKVFKELETELSEINVFKESVQIFEVCKDLYEIIHEINQEIELTCDFIIDGKQVQSFKILNEQIEKYLNVQDFYFEKWISISLLSQLIQQIVLKYDISQLVGNQDILDYYEEMIDCEFKEFIYSETQCVEIYVITKVISKLLSISNIELSFLVKLTGNTVVQYSSDLFNQEKANMLIDFIYKELQFFIK